MTEAEKTRRRAVSAYLISIASDDRFNELMAMIESRTDDLVEAMINGDGEVGFDLIRGKIRGRREVVRFVKGLIERGTVQDTLDT